MAGTGNAVGNNQLKRVVLESFCATLAESFARSACSFAPEQLKSPLLNTFITLKTLQDLHHLY